MALRSKSAFEVGGMEWQRAYVAPTVFTSYYEYMQIPTYQIGRTENCSFSCKIRLVDAKQKDGIMSTWQQTSAQGRALLGISLAWIILMS